MSGAGFWQRTRYVTLPLMRNVILFVLVTGFIAAIQLLNLVRIVSLFYLGQWDRQWFEWAHLYLWQALIMLDAVVVWLLWIRAVPAPAAARA